MGSGPICGERSNLGKDFLRSVEEHFGVAHTSELCLEELDLGVYRFSMLIGNYVIEEG